MVQSLKIETVRKFQFHYDSINTDLLLANPGSTKKFQFHYDSINTAKVADLQAKKAGFNSIMIQLIHSLCNSENKCFACFNSIMIQLIQKQASREKQNYLRFNSIMIQLIQGVAERRSTSPNVSIPL